MHQPSALLATRTDDKEQRSCISSRLVPLRWIIQEACVQTEMPDMSMTQDTHA